MLKSFSITTPQSPRNLRRYSLQPSGERPRRFEATPHSIWGLCDFKSVVSSVHLLDIGCHPFALRSLVVAYMSGVVANAALLNIEDSLGNRKTKGQSGVYLFSNTQVQIKPG